MERIVLQPVKEENRTRDTGARRSTPDRSTGKPFHGAGV